jgi:capsular polysaccharide biosynthesis protein
VTSTSRRGWQGGRRDDASLAEVLYVLRGRRLLVIGVVLVLAGTALLFGLLRDPVYNAEATVSLVPRDELNDVEAREAFVQEVQNAVVNEDLLLEVVDRTGAEAGIGEFPELSDVRPFVTSDGGAGMLVRFSGPEPELAARAANVYARLFVERVERLDAGQLAGGVPAADAAVERKAVPPERSSLWPLIYAAVAAGAGLLLGGAAALLLERQASGWRGVRDAELTLGAPVLGTIPDYSLTTSEGEG